MNQRKIRCAIYTRKSTEEGLDQDFNSLDAQHEACAAYIASQKHEGWKMLLSRYDDGGISGGTLERPALQRLLTDIDAGRIDMVVVYKIDRLTRSLADFAKLVDRLEQAECSFVSVTQAFNTSSSMGRLTLNVLLSFAQFEREVTAERIRDKIAASKKKGMWMGGIPPLGYDPHPDKTRRELVVNEAEAAAVRQIFALYDTRGCLNAVARETHRLGLRSKHHVFANGREQGGNGFSRGQIHKLLTNPIYLGRIRHKNKTWPGLHSAILDEDLWDRVQMKLQAASAKRRGYRAPAQIAAANTAPLLGKVWDETGDVLTPTHTNRHGRRIPYYVSNRLISKGRHPDAWRLPAAALETAIGTVISEHLSEHAHRHDVLSAVDAADTDAATEAAVRLARKASGSDIKVIVHLIDRIEIARGRVRIDLSEETLSSELSLPGETLARSLLHVSAPFTCRRRGAEMKILAGSMSRSPDQTLFCALRNAHTWSNMLRTGTSLTAIAKEAGFSESYVARIIPLACLSPRMQQAIVDGTQPVTLSLETLVRGGIPLDWQRQHELFAS